MKTTQLAIMIVLVFSVSANVWLGVKLHAQNAELARARIDRIQLNQSVSEQIKNTAAMKSQITTAALQEAVAEVTANPVKQEIIRLSKNETLKQADATLTDSQSGAVRIGAGIARSLMLAHPGQYQTNSEIMDAALYEYQKMLNGSAARQNSDN